MNKNLEIFQAEFTKYQQLFGLQGYKFYFERCVLTDCYADIIIDQHEMIAKVRLDKKTKGQQLLDTAKHEAIHLLTNRVVSLAKARFTSEEEIYESWEELVRKLEVLIP